MCEPCGSPRRDVTTVALNVDGLTDELRLLLELDCSDLTEFNKVIKKRIPMPMATFKHHAFNERAQIKGIEITGKLVPMDWNLKWHPWDEVWMVMRELFENRSCTVSRRGIITQKKSEAL